MSSLNLFHSTDITIPLEACGPTYVADYTPDKVENQNVSLETFNPYDQSERSELMKAAISGKNVDQLLGCSDGCVPITKKKPVIFTKTICKESKKCCWEFFLGYCRFTTINDFITKLIQVKPEDCIIVHAPGSCFYDDAEVLFSAIKSCKASEKWISGPYIMNTPSAFILMAGTKIIPSVCNVMRITTPNISGGGAIQDASNAINTGIHRYDKMYNTLISEGFITAEDKLSIVNDQKSICLHGQKLAQAIASFNQRHG